MKKLKELVENFLIKNKIKNVQFIQIDKYLFQYTIPIDGSPEGFNILIERNSTVLTGSPYTLENVKTLEPKKEYHIALNPWIYNKSDAKKQKKLMKEALKEFPNAIVIFGDDPFDFNPNSVLHGVEYYDGQSNDINDLWNQFDDVINNED